MDLHPLEMLAVCRIAIEHDFVPSWHGLPVVCAGADKAQASGLLVGVKGHPIVYFKTKPGTAQSELSKSPGCQIGYTANSRQRFMV